MSEVRRTGPKAVTRRLWRSLHRVVPVSIGLATLMVVGTSSFCTRRLTVAQKFGTGC